MALVRRDPFARVELHRETVSPGGAAGFGTCGWCGGTNARGRVYVYRFETDGGSRSPVLGTGGRSVTFCSESCRKAYQS